VGGRGPRRLRHRGRRGQQRFVTRTRLGIPALFHAEALNGFLAGGHMSFPTPTGLAAAWSPELVQEMAELIRRQMRRTGMLHALSPVLDVALDPRWGRVHETYGEDPYLCTALGVAYVRGLQGTDLASGVIATAKHFLGYALPESGSNTSPFDAGARRTRDVFAQPFEAAIQLAGLRSVMNSYADVDGIPAGCSREVLTGLLRETLGFDGFVSSDYGTTEQLVHRQEVARNAAEAARLALRAGLDVELPTPFAYGDVLAEEIRSGRVSPAELDLSVWRVLRAKFEVGLFEHPYPTERIDLAAAASEGTELSRELARRSIVLAANDGILPLEPGTLRVAVIGPHADAAALHFATYTYASWRQAADAQRAGAQGTMVGAEDPVLEWFGAVGPMMEPERLVHERHGARSLAEAVGEYAADVQVVRGCTLTQELGPDEVERAVEVARTADVVVLALGGASLWFNGERTEGEASDSADIALPAPQARLAEAVAATGTPLVTVLVQGRPYALPDAVLGASALLVSSFAGPFGAAAIAEVLFGVVNPGGKLPYSVPRHTGQVPIYHHKRAGSGHRNPLPLGGARHYLDLPGTPLFPFGHGLSYTDFVLSDLRCGDPCGTDGETSVAATVTNVGARAGATVVQLYLGVRGHIVSRPRQQLAGFARVVLPPGASVRCSFTVAAAQLSASTESREVAVQPGPVSVFLGLDSEDRALTGGFELRGPLRVLKPAERAFLSRCQVSSVQGPRR
jgi:beta-glucosidase-like glycosyl hydrolase